MKKYIFFSIILFPIFLFAQSEATLLGTWDDESLQGTWLFDNTYNEIWGVAVNDKEYAVIGSTVGTHFIDITDPANPWEAFFLEGAATGGQIIHRDYHDYGCHLYIACGENTNSSTSTLQIVDLSSLPNSLDVVYDSGDLFTTSHNIFIDSATARLYCLAVNGGPQGFDPMRIYDISNPADPVFVGGYNQFGGNYIGHVHDVYADDNIAYLNCGNDGFYVVDFTDASNPVTLGSMTQYPMSGYNHSGWMAADGIHYYMADENHGMDLKVVDISDPTDLEVSTLFNADGGSSSITHNQIVACDYLYTSYYYDGLQIFDVSDPLNPVRVKYYHTSDEPNTESFKGAWGIYPFLPSGNILVSDMQNGLFIFEGIDPDCAGIPNDLACSLSTDTEDLESASNQLRVFPQPVNADVLNIEIQLSKTQQNTQITMYDISGRIIFSDERDLVSGMNTIQYPGMANIVAGFYVLEVKSSEFSLTQKVVIGK